MPAIRCVENGAATSGTKLIKNPPAGTKAAFFEDIKTRMAIKYEYSIALIKTGGDDRIRTCEGLLTLNDLANRRFQPLSHVSGWALKTESNSSGRANFVKFCAIIQRT
jgi:hypothetical protein